MHFIILSLAPTHAPYHSKHCSTHATYHSKPCSNHAPYHCKPCSTHALYHYALKNISVGEDEYIVTPVSSHKLLGIHVDNTLSWKTHIAHLCSKLRSRLYLFNQVKYLMPLSIRKQYFSGLVMDYGCVIWGKLQQGSTY